MGIFTLYVEIVYSLLQLFLQIGKFYVQVYYFVDRPNLKFKNLMKNTQIKEDYKKCFEILNCDFFIQLKISKCENSYA